VVKIHGDFHLITFLDFNNNRNETSLFAAKIGRLIWLDTLQFLRQHVVGGNVECGRLRIGGEKKVVMLKPTSKIQQQHHLTQTQNQQQAKYGVFFSQKTNWIEFLHKFNQQLTGGFFRNSLEAVLMMLMSLGIAEPQTRRFIWQ